MKETARAAQAWADYLALGADRSLEKLLVRYQSASNVPSRRLKTLADWSRLYGWQGRLLDLARADAEATAKRESEVRAALQAEGIRNRANRVAHLNDRHDRMRRLLEERGDDPDMLNVPGGATGLLVHQVKQIGAGPAAQMVDEYVLDAGLLSEFRQHEKQAAQELGQWVEKGELTGKDGKDLFKLYQGLDIDKV